jgi:hypothetical protein
MFMEDILQYPCHKRLLPNAGIWSGVNYTTIKWVCIIVVSENVGTLVKAVVEKIEIKFANNSLKKDDNDFATEVLNAYRKERY